MKETSVINGGAVFPTINFKTILYLLVSIAVLFIAIIPARIISGIFSQDVSIFYISSQALLCYWSLWYGASYVRQSKSMNPY